MMEKVKKFISKHLKLIMIVAAIIVAGVAGLKFYTSQPANVINVVSPKFAGYQGYGTLSYNKNEVNEKLAKVLMQKNGISKQDIEAISNGHIPSKFESNVDQMNKLKDVETQVESIKISFSKENRLSNGDRVTLKISATKDIPIKSGTKSFKVSGLKKVTKYTVKDAMGKLAPKFIGIDGFGSVKSSSKREKLFDETSSSESASLKNGDEVKFDLSDEYRASQLAKGHVLSGSKVVSYKVTGLPTINAIVDWNKMIDLDLTAAKAANTSDDYNKFDIQALDTYATVSDNYSSYNSYSVEEPYADLPDSAQFVTFITVFKITKTYPKWPDDPAEVSYKNYGYQSVPYYDGKLHTEKIDDMKYSGESRSSAEDAVASFKADNAHAQKIVIK